ELVDRGQLLHELPGILARTEPLEHERRQLVARFGAQHFETRAAAHTGLVSIAHLPSLSGGEHPGTQALRSNACPTARSPRLRTRCSGCPRPRATTNCAARTAGGCGRRIRMPEAARASSTPCRAPGSSWGRQRHVPPTTRAACVQPRRRPPCSHRRL